MRTCRVCGCTDLQACPGGCHWVEPDLCSACAGSDDFDEAADMMRLQLVCAALSFVERSTPDAPRGKEPQCREWTLRRNGREFVFALNDHNKPRPCRHILVGPNEAILFDHLPMPIFYFREAGDVVLMPHYSADELLPMFEAAG